MNIGTRIKNVRKSRGLTQEDIYIGIISNSHYSNIEKGRYSAANDTIKLIASRLCVPENYLISVDEDCVITQNLLDEYRILIDTGDINDANLFLGINKEKFSYIPSLKQEAYYHLLTFLHKLNSNLHEEAMSLFSQHFENGIQVVLEGEYKQLYLYATGMYYYFKKNHNIAIYSFKELLNTTEVHSHYKAKVFYNIAMSLYSLFKYNEAIDYVKESKILYLKLHEWDKVGDCYNLLVVLNREIKNYSEAETYIKKGLEIAMPDSFELKAKLNHNSSLIHFDHERFKCALKCVNISIRIKKEKFLPGIFVSYILKLNILLNTDDLVLLNQTLKSTYGYISKSTQEAQYFYIVAKKHYILGELELYEININNALKIYEKEKEWKELKKVAQDYSFFLEKNRRYKKSLELQKLCNVAMKNIYEERLLW